MVKLQRRKDAKSVQALQGSLQLLDQERQNKHTFFVQTAEELDEFDYDGIQQNRQVITEDNLD